MAGQQAKRKLVKRPGLFRAAQELDCNYSHLRRVVIGQRESKSLLTRYRAWQDGQKKPVPI
jgi:hypothetical protein